VSNLTKADQPIQHLTIKGNDEISSIALHINELYNKFKSSQDKLERQMVVQTQELYEKNAKLQQEMSKRILAERRMVSNRECLTQIAKYDQLTSLPNRVFFNEILNKSINHAKRHENILAILLIDLDVFSNLKTTLGDTNSDSVLKEMSRRFLSV